MTTDPRQTQYTVTMMKDMQTLTILTKRPKHKNSSISTRDVKGAKYLQEAEITGLNNRGAF